MNNKISVIEILVSVKDYESKTIKTKTISASKEGWQTGYVDKELLMASVELIIENLVKED
jgi:hypothetical protein